jgi:hypothetical protein
MGMAPRSTIKFGLAILISGCVSSAIAYQQDNSLMQGKARATPAGTALSSEKIRTVPAEKPARCYLALHLEMVGVPFAARVADAATGVAHACDVEPKKERENKVNPE